MDSGLQLDRHLALTSGEPLSEAREAPLELKRARLTQLQAREPHWKAGLIRVPPGGDSWTGCACVPPGLRTPEAGGLAQNSARLVDRMSGAFIIRGLTRRDVHSTEDSACLASR